MLTALRRETIRERVLSLPLTGPGSPKLTQTLENIAALAAENRETRIQIACSLSLASACNRFGSLSRTLAVWGNEVFTQANSTQSAPTLYLTTTFSYSSRFC